MSDWFPATGRINGAHHPASSPPSPPPGPLVAPLLSRVSPNPGSRLIIRPLAASPGDFRRSGSTHARVRFLGRLFSQIRAVNDTEARAARQADPAALLSFQASAPSKSDRLHTNERCNLFINQGGGLRWQAFLIVLINRGRDGRRSGRLLFLRWRNVSEWRGTVDGSHAHTHTH